MKEIQIGIRSKNEWLGDDFLVTKNQLEFVFEYSVVAITKTVTYEISFMDMLKIPSEIREQMKNVIYARQKMIVQTSLNHYNNLKQISKNISENED